MSRGRRVLLVVLTCGALGGVMLSVTLRGKEPRYGGKGLRQWLEIGYDSPKGSQQEAEAFAAVRQIGTNALPFLLKWLSCEPSTLRYNVRVPSEGVPEWLGQERSSDLVDRDGERQVLLGEFGFGVLGPLAAPAVPELTVLARDYPVKCDRGMTALAETGKLGIPALRALLEDERLKHRDIAAMFLIQAYVNSGDAESATPVIERCLNDHDPYVIRDTICTVAPSPLHRSGFSTNFGVTAIAKLTRHRDHRVRWWAIDGLREYGKGARPAIPALSKALQDPEFSVRLSATNALEKIAPEVLANGGNTGHP